MTNRDWYKQQPRGGNKPYRFAPKWNIQTIMSIIDGLGKNVPLLDMQVGIVKMYDVSLESAGNWIDIARRVEADLNQGFTIGEALERDHDRRNQMRRKTK